MLLSIAGTRKKIMKFTNQPKLLNHIVIFEKKLLRKMYMHNSQFHLYSIYAYIRMTKMKLHAISTDAQIKFSAAIYVDKIKAGLKSRLPRFLQTNFGRLGYQFGKLFLYSYLSLPELTPHNSPFFSTSKKCFTKQFLALTQKKTQNSIFSIFQFSQF